MSDLTIVKGELENLLSSPEFDSPGKRAKLVTFFVEEIYKHVKFNCPGGEGLDGRDGPERQGLAAVVDAAKDYEFAAMQREFADK